MTRFTKGLVLAVAALLVGSMATVPASARPNYFKEFTGHYTEVKAAAEAKCGVCHEGADKKNKNDYGKALGAVIGKNEKDVAKIKEALVKVEAEKSSVEGKTFGDLLKAGKLPSGK
jgi:cytochrome c553